MKDAVKKYHCKIHAYCFMTNHFHILIETTDEEIWKIMKMIDQCYTSQMNYYYDEDGSLFRGRYASIILEDTNHFLAVSRYIHQNPLKAGIVSKPEDYFWSSYRTIIGKGDDRITDIEKTLSYFPNNSIEAYINFVLGSDLSEEENNFEWI